MKPIINLATGLLLIVLTTSYCPPDGWVVLDRPDCSVYFPQQPTEQKKTVASALGDLQLDMFIYQVPDDKKDSNLVYLYAETTYPDTAINSDKKDRVDKFFRGFVDGAVSNVHGKLLSEKTAQFEGFPGREIRVDFQEGAAIITLRGFLVHNKVFLLEAISLPKNDANKTISAFFDSFTLKK